MEYQRLDVEKNEVRLLKLIQDDEYAASIEHDEELERLIRLEMRTVSLNDFTAKSRDFMKSRGVSTYPFVRN
jgi:hypothetical protein